MRSVGHAFTFRPGGILRVLQTQCWVSDAFDPAAMPENQYPPLLPFLGLWDTGATGSVITQAVVDALHLKPTGMQLVNHAGGQTPQETYLVNIRLPNSVGFPLIPVTKAPLTGTHVLIGMDIISRGDFAISNKDGETIFTFRYPSTARYDFVKEEDRIAAGTQVDTWSQKKKKKR